MPETDLIKLYSSRILALAADMPLTDPLDSPQASAKARSPLCGSTVTVSLCVDGDQISAYAQDVKACALGQAAAAVVGGAIMGRTQAQVQAARDQLRAMLKDDGPPPLPPFDGLEVLIPARDYKNRHASILLSLDATLDALKQVHSQQAAQ